MLKEIRGGWVNPSVAVALLTLDEEKIYQITTLVLKQNYALININVSASQRKSGKFIIIETNLFYLNFTLSLYCKLF